jgi:hypothetical protein
VGKQRNKAKTKGERSQSVNSVDWEQRAQELFEAGVIDATALGTAQPFTKNKGRDR